jgi:hypothetical protein
MKSWRHILDRLSAGTDRAGLSNLIVQALLLRGLRRTPMGFIGTILLRKALSGNGRVFGMDLASRRQARWAFLASLLQKLAARSRQIAVRRRLSRSPCAGRPRRLPIR